MAMAVRPSSAGTSPGVQSIPSVRPSVIGGAPPLSARGRGAGAAGRRPAASSAARTRAPVRASSSALARSLANTMGGRHQNTSSSGSTSDRCRVRMPRLPMLANATPKVITHSAANTRYGVVSISLGACASRRQLTMPTSSSAVISSAGSAAASPRASKSSGRVSVRNAARGQSCGPSIEIGSNDEPPWVVVRLDLVEDVGEPVGDDFFPGSSPSEASSAGSR